MGMVEVLFFGRMADVAGRRRMRVERPGEGLQLMALRDSLFDEATRTVVRMSVNQIQVTADQALNDGDEIAFFSLFSGG